MTRHLLPFFLGAFVVALAGCAVRPAGAHPGNAEVQRFTPEVAPGDKPLYANMVRHGDTLYLAGMLGFKPGTRELGDGVIEQTRLAINGIEDVLGQADADLSDVLQCTVYLSDINDYAAMNAVYRGRFQDNPPARTAVAVAGLPLGAAIEVACIAVAP